jgi:hypothetical protein
MSAGALEPMVEEVMRDESASDWLKGALSAALDRDPLDALNDALVLAAALEERVRTVLALTEAE